MRDRLCTAIVVLFCVFVVAPMTYWLTDRIPPFERHSGYISPQNIAPGETFDVHWKGKVNRFCEGVVYRRIKDSKNDIYNLPASIVRYNEPGRTRDVPISQNRIPLMAACGPAEYVADAQHVCNWTHKFWPIRVYEPSIKFNIACKGEPK
jgi:hypothetical protein